jgi:uncharacterized membrane protein HdeD (DUF308 family)
MAFWITLIRGMLAIALGVALIIQPDKARPMLVNFMGMFWLVSGIVSLRWGARGERARGWSLLAGAIGVLAGVSMLSRRFTAGMAGEDVLVTVVGLIIMLTGLMHIFGGFRTGPVETHLLSQHRKWSWTAFLLGLFEMILGLMLVIEPLGRGPLVYLAATVWALLGGIILIGDAVRLRRERLRRMRQQAKQETQVDDGR